MCSLMKVLFGKSLVLIDSSVCCIAFGDSSEVDVKSPPPLQSQTIALSLLVYIPVWH